MPLELATRLILRRTEDGSPLPGERVRQIAASWAEVPEAAVSVVDDVPGRGDSRVTANEVQLDESRSRWDLLLSRADDDDESVRWEVRLTGIFEADRTTLAARLRRESSDHRLRPLSGSPVPPRVISDVLAATDIDSYDGPIRTQARYRELAAGDVEGFVKLQLTAEDRRLPVIAVAKGMPREQRLDVKQLTRALAGFAHVILVDRQALQPLGSEIGNLSLAPGNVRIWWSGLELDDESGAHPVIRPPFEDPNRVVQDIRELVLSVARDRWREPDRIVAFDRAMRQARDEAGRAAAHRVVEELQDLRAAAAADRERVEHAPQADATPKVDIEAYETRLTEMAGDVATVNEELGRQRELAEVAEAMLEESEAERERLEQDRRSMHGQLEGLKAQMKDLAGAGPESTPTEAAVLAQEVRESWERRLTSNDRETYVLADFEIRADFVSTVSAAGADREKVIDTVMEVACGRAKEIEGRRLHRLRRGTGGNAPERQRDSDGAVAWRCNLQTNSASARRLHYWACPGGRLEFVCVVTHDDFSISE